MTLYIGSKKIEEFESYISRMVFSETGNRCKDHPEHNGKQGVCASCLRERLTRLSSASYKEANSRLLNSWSPSPYFSPVDYSSPSSSTSASPAPWHHTRNSGSSLMGIMARPLSSSLSSSSFMVRTGSIKGLKKSKSIALVTRNMDDEEANNGKNKKKGFWSKLLSFKGKRNVLTHSTSLRLMIGRVNRFF